MKVVTRLPKLAFSIIAALYWILGNGLDRIPQGQSPIMACRLPNDVPPYVILVSSPLNIRLLPLSSRATGTAVFPHPIFYHITFVIPPADPGLTIGRIRKPQSLT